jgi:hypothetical protein
MKRLHALTSSGLRLEASEMPDLFARVYARRGAKALVRIAQVFGLNKTETARIFGISRQGLDEWYRKGVPMGRLGDVTRTQALANALHDRFVPERLPQIVRSPLPGLDGATILAALRTHGTIAIFDLLDRAFSYMPA